jgi:hypothetical protein
LSLQGTVNATKKGARQMPSRRWLAGLTVPMMIGAAVVTNAGIAAADPANDAYLAQLRGLGFSWPPGHEDGLIGTAFLICDDLGWGWTPDQIAQHVHANLDPRNVTFGDIASLVGVAHAVYCPNQRCWAPHC